MPEAPSHYAKGFSWFHYDIFGQNPPEPLARGIALAADQIAVLLDVLPKRLPTSGPPIVAGFSQGGMLSFALALRYPERLRFALPISGLLPEPLWPVNPAGKVQIPIRALHGSDDPLVPVMTDRDLTRRLQRLGYDAQLEEFPASVHTITAPMQDRINQLLREHLQP